MKKIDVSKVLHENTNDMLKNVLDSVPEIRFVCKLDEALEKRGLTQAKLATLCGLRPSTISEIVKGSRSAITKTHIASIMIVLRITDIREILDIEFAPETTKQFKKEEKAWIENDVIPEDIVNLYKNNAEQYINTDIRG